MDKISKLLHSRLDVTQAYPIVTPIFQASAFQSHSPFFYTRKNNPNVEEIENAVAILEESKYCVATSTGMSAIAMALDLLVSGGTLVVNTDAYGCSLKTYQIFTKKLGIKLCPIDLSVASNWKLIPKDTQMVIFETPTNPYLKHLDIKRISAYTKRRNPKALIVVDNTWATPLFQQPLKWGADITLHSATKYFSGHSDVMAGFIATNDESLHKKFLDYRFFFGAVLEPFSAWLLKRSMQTFALRLREHQNVTKKMKIFLENLPQVLKVYYPDIDGKQLTGYGTLLFFDLREDLVDYYQDFIKALQLFDTGTGMACVTSMVAQPYTGSHGSLTESEKSEMGLGKGLVRMNFGFEAIDDIKADIKNAFTKMEEAARISIKVEDGLKVSWK